MRRFHQFLKASLFFTILSCSSEKDPEPIVEPDPLPLLTIDASEYFLFSGQESWIFIIDSAGSILETQQLKEHETLKFTAATKNDSITLVQVNHYDSYGSEIRIFGGIKTQTTLKFAFVDGAIPPMPASTGNASVKVTNYPTIGNNPLVLASPDVNSTEVDNAGEVNSIFPIHGDKTPILLSAYNNDGVPFYKWTTNVSAGQSIVEDFSAFTPYPSTLTVPVQHNMSYLLSGYNSNWEYYGTAFAYGQWYNGSGTPAVMGYLPGYNGYYTEVRAILPAANHMAVSYRKRGTLPNTSQLELPAFSCSVLNSSVKSPTFSINKNYTYMHASWGYNPGGSPPVYCNLYAPPNFQLKMTNLPAEILSKYPELDLNNLVFNDCFFSENLDGYTYEQTISDFMKNHYHVNTFEYRLYEFAP
jgi:hypothetical protein